MGDLHPTAYTTTATIHTHVRKATKIAKTLQPLQQIEATIGGHADLARDPLTDAASEILEAISPPGETH